MILFYVMLTVHLYIIL